MKKALFLILTACLTLAAQATFTITATAANEQNLSTTISATAIPNQIAVIENTLAGSNFPGVASLELWPNSPGNIPTQAVTLVAAVTTTSQTTLTLSSTTNIQACNGFMIGTEHMKVVSVSSPNVTVLRALIGTTASTYANGTAVTVTRVGGGTCLLKAILADSVSSMMNAQLQGAALTSQAAAIASAQASITSLLVAAIQ